MNKVFLTGRLPQAPEGRYTQTGKAVTNFAVACNYRTADGERTDYIDCVAWDKLAETIANNLTKGRQVAVEGRLSIRRYTGQDGQSRKAYEVIAAEVEFLDAGKRKDAADFGQLGEEIPF